ncbi:MAG TPA: metallophosphoesterase [Nitrososphaeraceae archaeon]|nr:metallophosphoesterase [Nitrososphaeraceae archaeon]
MVQRLTCPKLIVFPGNHDHRHTGYLLFKRFFPFSKQVNELDNLIILVVGTARPDRDEGEVGHRQNIWMEEVLRKDKKENKDCCNAPSSNSNS